MAYRVISKDESTKELLDRVTASFLQERGADFTIREVCQAAGVSVGTFYTYYKSKDELIAARLFHTDAYLKEALKETEGQSAADSIRLITGAFFSYLESRGRSSCREVSRCMIYGFKQWKTWDDNLILTALQEQIQRGVKEGVFRPHPLPSCMALGLFSLCMGAAQTWCQDEDILSLSAYGKPLVEGFLEMAGAGGEE